MFFILSIDTLHTVEQVLTFVHFITVVPGAGTSILKHATEFVSHDVFSFNEDHAETLREITFID